MGKDKIELIKGTTQLDEKLEQDFSAMLAKSSKQQRQELSEAFGGDIIEPPIPFFDFAHLQINNTWHAKCIERVSSVATSFGWCISHETKEDSNVIEDYLNELCNNFDEATYRRNHSNFEELSNCLAADYRSLGNAYVEIIRDQSGKPIELYHVPAITVRLGRKTGFYQLQQLNSFPTDATNNSGNISPGRVRDGTYSLFGGMSFKKIFFKAFGDDREFNTNGDLIAGDVGDCELASEIHHIKRFHSCSPFYGLPEWLTSFSEMIGDESASSWNNSFFENNRVPRWLFSIFGDMDDAEKDNFVNYFVDVLRGRPHVPTILRIPADSNAKVEVQKLEADVNEASFLQYREATRNEIIASHGVPPRMLGIITAGQLGGQGDAQKQREDFKSFTIQPLQKVLAGWINELLLPSAGYEGYSLEFKDFDFTDSEETKKMSEAYTGLVKNGIATFNEARKKLGLDPIEEEWANKHFVFTKDGIRELSDESLAQMNDDEKEEQSVMHDLQALRRQLANDKDEEVKEDDNKRTAADA